MQLEGKWKYACRRYRELHSEDEFPESKPVWTTRGWRDSTRLLPNAEAQLKMGTWIPWALQELRNQLDSLLAQFGTLSVEQASAVSDEPEDDVSDDEVV